MSERGDFTTDRRMILLSGVAVAIGGIAAVVAAFLLRLIALFTNLFYFHQLSIAIRSPADNSLGGAAVFAPIVGGLIIGLMARYGSERIRGHGIPEAMEAILIGRSRMQPKVAVLKPLSSAISIGSGGPFGAEGPIIMTGGAIGSIIAQSFHMTASERKTLLVAGAAAGMSATFATPMAAVLLAVELLLFEWKPRSLIPVAVASSVAALVRPYLLGHGPLFVVPAHALLPTSAYFSALVVGLSGGGLSILLTAAVYAAEDAFKRLPLHWMWWPAIGGLAVGLGGLLQPHALGVGYDVLGQLVAGHYVVRALLALIVVKGLIWAISLGSGTSGGVLAPLLMMGGALGALEAGVLPGGDRALWPLVGMAALLGGTMRAPLTGVIFALELTYDIALLPALLVAAIAADAVTVLALKRSILTEKVARRGFHVSREYSVDPLELLTVEDVMTPEVTTISSAADVKDLLAAGYFNGARRHNGYPVVDGEGQLVGVITGANLLDYWLVADGAKGELGPIIVHDLTERSPVVAFSQESCRLAAERMAEAEVGQLPVLSSETPHRLVGIITRSDLLKPHARRLDEEGRRERFIGGGTSEGRTGEPE